MDPVDLQRTANLLALGFQYPGHQMGGNQFKKGTKTYEVPFPFYFERTLMQT